MFCDCQDAFEPTRKPISELWTFEHHPKSQIQDQQDESGGASHNQSSSTIHDARDVSLPIFHQFCQKTVGSPKCVVIAKVHLNRQGSQYPCAKSIDYREFRVKKLLSPSSMGKNNSDSSRVKVSKFPRPKASSAIQNKWRELCCWSYPNIKKMWNISDLESMKDTSQRPIKKSSFLFLRYGSRSKLLQHIAEITVRSKLQDAILWFLWGFLLVAKTLDPWRSAISFMSQKKDSKHLIWKIWRCIPCWIYL